MTELAHTTECMYRHFLSYSGFADTAEVKKAYFHGAGERQPDNVHAGTGGRCPLCEEVYEK